MSRKRTGPFVITGAAFHAERFRGGDLDVIDITRIPERFENRVRKSQDQDVLRGFFAEKMIDPIGLFFGEGVVDDAVQFLRRGEIRPERFLDDHARPAAFLRFVQPRCLQMFQDRLELLRRDREIKKPVAARAAFLVDFIEAFRQRLL